MAAAFATPAPKQAWPPESTPLTAAKRAEHAEGFAYCAGSTKHSECGLPHQGEPIRAPRLQTRLMNEGVVQASCGWRHTAFLLSSGEAYTCGDGSYGKLGSGDTELKPEPCCVPFSTPVHVMAISCGQHHTAFVGADRTVWTCGLGLYGQLGHGEALNELTPRCVEMARGKVVAAACGDLHTLLLFEDGRPLSCGLGDGGRLGLPVPKGEDGVGCVTTPREVPLDTYHPHALLSYFLGCLTDTLARDLAGAAQHRPQAGGGLPRGGRELWRRAFGLDLLGRQRLHLWPRRAGPAGARGHAERGHAAQGD